MLDSTHDNFVWWFLGVVGLALLLIMYGLTSGLALPEKQKTARIRMFASIGLGIIFLVLPIFKPYVSSYSRVEDLEIKKVDNVSSPVDIVKHEEDQSSDIEQIRREVNRLRDDLDRMNLYFTTMVQLFSSLGFVMCLVLALRFRKAMVTVNGGDSESHK